MSEPAAEQEPEDDCGDQDVSHMELAWEMLELTCSICSKSVALIKILIYFELSKLVTPLTLSGLGFLEILEGMIPLSKI